MEMSLDHRAILTGVVVVFVVALGIWALFVWLRTSVPQWLKKNYVLHRLLVFGRMHRREVGISFLVVTIIVVLSASLMWMVLGRQPDQFVRTLLMSPGSVFGILIGAATLVGVVVTATRIHQLTQRINRYDELLIKATDLLMEVAEGKTASNEVRMICTTPLHGNMTERKTSYYREYKWALERVRENAVLRILHYPVQEMEEFYDRFRSRFADREVDDAYRESQQFLADVAEMSRARRALVAARTTAPPEHETRFLWEKVGYRILLSSERAVFYVPLFLPPEKKPDDETTKVRDHSATVEMVGFGSDDRYILAQFEEDFEYLWRASSWTGAERLEEWHLPSRSLDVSEMELGGEDAGRTVVIVHGLTGRVRDRRWRKRLEFRGRLARAGISSYEFEYSRREGEASEAADFSLTSAAHDLEEMLEEITEQRGKEELLLLGRGMALPIIANALEGQDCMCKTVVWQGITDPVKTMERSGHVRAFEEGYRDAERHQFVEIASVRVGAPFFDDLPKFEDLAVKWPANKHLHIMATQEDRVAPLDDTETFVERAIQEARCQDVELDVLDVENGAHTHLSSIEPFIDRTLALLQEWNWVNDLEDWG